MTEWELTLDCNYKCLYCTNGRNDCLKTPIKPVLDENILENHIKNLPVWTFLFGGEPFLHPKIEFILKTMEKYNKDFVIQTNFTQFDTIEKCKYYLTKKIQVSYHNTQIKNPEETFKKLLYFKQCIKRIDIMFLSLNDVQVYNKLSKFFDNVYLVPVCDFDINSQKENKTIRKGLETFCELKKSNPGICEKTNRSFVWLDMLNKKYSTKNKKCLYKEYYKLYAPDLKSYNCSHRINTEICPNDMCFLMDFNNEIYSILTKGN